MRQEVRSKKQEVRRDLQFSTADLIFFNFQFSIFDYSLRSSLC